jgi:single-strand DNA-binding protein
LINNVVLVGRLTKDPDLRYTSNGTGVATFTLAVNRNFTNQSGEREADFINCVIWRKPAETMANYARKGTLLGITGRIQTRSYDNQQGQRVYVTEVVADNFQLLESRNASEQRRTSDSGSSNNTTYNSNSSSGFGNNQSNQTQSSQPSGMPSFDRDNSDPFGNASIDISDDDLPF